MRPLSSALCCAFVATLISTTQARTPRKPRLYDCQGKLQTAIEKYEKRKFGDARTILDEVKLQCAGHQAMDSVLYYLGMTMLRTKKGDEARSEFQQLVRDYGTSPFYEEAQFRIGHSSLIGSNSFDRDQSGTKEAIRELSSFLDSYGESTFADSARAYLEEAREKLAKKQFMNARHYEKIDQYEAAVVYYKILVSEFPESKLIPDAKLAMAENLIKVNRLSEASDLLEELAEGSATKEITQRVQALRASMKAVTKE